MTRFQTYPHEQSPSSSSRNAPTPTSVAVATSNATPPAPTREAIAELAYSKYIKSGRQEGRCRENWSEAEAELKQSALERPHSPKTPVEASLDMSSEGAGGAIGNDAPATPPALQPTGVRHKPEAVRPSGRT